MSRPAFRVLAVGIIAAVAGSMAPTAAECTREHHGELLLSGDQSMVISGGVFCQHGTITLRGNAKLVITGATLRIDGFRQTVWQKWVEISVCDNAQLILNDVLVEAPGAGEGGVWIYARGASQVVLDGVHPVPPGRVWATATGDATLKVRDSRLAEVRVAQDASVSLVRSSVDWAVNLQFNGAARVTLESLRPGFHTTWSIPEGQGVRPRLAIEDTDVGAWSVEVFDRADVVVRNSAVARVILGLAQLPEVVTLAEGLHQFWALHPVARTGSHGNLSLENTSVGHWSVNIGDRRGPLEIRDARVGGIQTWGSSIPLTLTNVVLWTLTAADEHLRLDCDAVIVQQGMELDAARIDMYGSISFGTSSTVVWKNSRLVREYTILISRGSTGQPAGGTRLSLEDPSGAVSIHTADEGGAVRFQIAFDDSTYAQTWYLVAGEGASALRVPITLLTATPYRVAVP